MLVNLGIGIPTLVSNFVPSGVRVYFQSENGLIGTGAPPADGMHHPLLTDAGGKPVSALPGACTFDSAMSFGLIRGGHLDMTVLGALQVDAAGRLANWMIPGKMVPGHGRRHGSRVRREARHRRHAAHGEGPAEDRKTVLAAAHFRAAGRPRRHRARGDRLPRRARHAARDGARRDGSAGAGSYASRARGARVRSDAWCCSAHTPAFARAAHAAADGGRAHRGQAAVADQCLACHRRCARLSASWRKTTLGFCRFSKARSWWASYRSATSRAGRSCTTGPAVREIMTTRVHTVVPETKVPECIALMHASRIRHLPVHERRQRCSAFSPFAT